MRQSHDVSPLVPGGRVAEKKKAMSDESRRAEPRISVTGAVLSYRKKGFWARLTGGPKEENSLPIRNLSPKGACFACKGKLRRRQRLDVMIDFRNTGERAALAAEVVWVEHVEVEDNYQRRVGVKFFAVGPLAAAKLTRAMRSGLYDARRDNAEPRVLQRLASGQRLRPE